MKPVPGKDQQTMPELLSWLDRNGGRRDTGIKPKPETEIKDKYTPFCAYTR